MVQLSVPTGQTFYQSTATNRHVLQLNVIVSFQFFIVDNASFFFSYVIEDSYKYFLVNCKLTGSLVLFPS